jgi:hypothetical protein
VDRLFGRALDHSLGSARAGFVRWIILCARSCALGHSLFSCASFVRGSRSLGHSFVGSARGSHSLDNFVGCMWAVC